MLLIGEKDALDLKKVGIFPIVHGVRSLALREHITATSTVRRLEALVAAGRLAADFATDLADSLHFLMALKLKAGIAKLDTQRPVSGGVPTAKLSSLERDLLKDAFALVKRFKTLVRHQLREQDVAKGIDPAQAMRQLLDFIGSRPLVGYFLEFDVAMLNREIWPLLGVRLPQPKIEVSAMYYDFKNRQLPPHERGGMIDLRFATMINELGLPLRDAHNPLNDAVMAGLAFVKLRGLLAQR